MLCFFRGSDIPIYCYCHPVECCAVLSLDGDIRAITGCSCASVLPPVATQRPAAVFNLFYFVEFLTSALEVNFNVMRFINFIWLSSGYIISQCCQLFNLIVFFFLFTCDSM